MQTLTPIAALPTETAVLARLRAAHPCGKVLPLLSFGDDSVPAAARCTLIATAIGAIQALNGAPEIVATLQRFRSDSVRCVTVRAEAYRNDTTGAVELPRWTVEFHSDRQPPLAVDISRLTGDARAFMVLDEFGFTAAQICARAI